MVEERQLKIVDPEGRGNIRNKSVIYPCSQLTMGVV